MQDFARQEGRIPHEDIDVREDLFNDVPDEIVAEAFSTEEPPQSQTPFGAIWPEEEWPDLPARFLAATQDRLFPFALQQQVAEDRLGLAVQAVPGGDLFARGHPEQVIAALL